MIGGKGVTPRNYATRAQKSLPKWMKTLKNSGPAFADDVAMIRFIMEQLDVAVHFSLPDSGMLFDDHLRGLVGQELRLPFQTVSIEYATTPDQPFDPVREFPVPKRLALAIESDDLAAEIGGHVSHRFGDCLRAQQERLYGNDRAVAVISICEIDSNWVVMPAAYVVAANDWQADPNICTPPLIDNRSAGTGFGYKGAVLPILPAWYQYVADKIAREHGEAAIIKHMLHDVQDEFRVTCELAEALTCSNVKPVDIQTADPAINRKRVRLGRQPLHTIKVLTVVVPASKGSTGTQGGEHSGRASPREHLRRGHIRELQDGRRIWVSSATIGAGNPGRVDKTYRIKPAA